MAGAAQFAVAIVLLAGASRAALVTSTQELVDGLDEGVPDLEIQGYLRVREPGLLPPVVAVDTELSLGQGALGLLDVGAGIKQDSAVLVAPRRTLQLRDLPLTNSVSYGQYAPDTSQTLTTWFPLFQLQQNATLLVSDSVVYIDPSDPDQVHTPHDRISALATALTIHCLQAACPNGNLPIMQALLASLKAGGQTQGVTTETPTSVMTEMAELPKVRLSCHKRTSLLLA